MASSTERAGSSPSLHSHYKSFITNTGRSAPELRIRTLALVVLPRLASPLASDFRFPRSTHPPHGKLRPPLMPDAAPPVNRYRRNSSRSNSNSAVLAITSNFSTLHQWFPCGPLLACHLTRSLPGLFLPRSRPWLLTTAAEGGLKPAPVSRFRGALPHRFNSYALEALRPERSWQP